MPKVVNRIAEEVLHVHGRLKARVPTGRVVHSQRPVASAHALEPFKNGPMHLVELADEARPADQRGSGARAHCVNPVEERSREVEDRRKDSGTHPRQVAEEDQDATQGQYEDEPEEDMNEELTIRPAGVVARLDPPLLGDGGDHNVKFLPGGLEVASEVFASSLNVGSHFPVVGSASLTPALGSRPKRPRPPTGAEASAFAAPPPPRRPAPPKPRRIVARSCTGRLWWCRRPP